MDNEESCRLTVSMVADYDLSTDLPDTSSENEESTSAVSLGGLLYGVNPNDILTCQYGFVSYGYGTFPLLSTGDISAFNNKLSVRCEGVPDLCNSSNLI